MFLFMFWAFVAMFGYAWQTTSAIIEMGAENIPWWRYAVVYICWLLWPLAIVVAALGAIGFGSWVIYHITKGVK